MRIGNGWDKHLSAEYEKPYFKQLEETVKAEYKKYRVFPPYDLIYAALKAVGYDDVKVVILGQDPYHGEGQANGLAFAVGDGVPLPPSLVNIFKELSEDLGCPAPKCGTLLGWAKQGILLLNTVLSVRSGMPQSHADIGWQTFTDAVIAALNARERPAAFILWGANAIAKKALIAPRHFVVCSPHPSPLSASRGFFGSRPFSKVNAFLTEQGQTPIDWADTEGHEYAPYYAAKGKILRV